MYVYNRYVYVYFVSILGDEMWPKRMRREETKPKGSGADNAGGHSTSSSMLCKEEPSM